ncbi:DUF4870 domain-containing protein [Aquimarina algicola]|uniref:DUF4870 domain-containing protein n=1 Tax=Aquimarina algicola TaxID=2589995 RepID=A0A504J102_9FLAO|nr:DUF4870 domain-containing protein [Aquimarina algicola]TPN82285.1 DUF4870 domain-containing protein [Aquimarina algicola]
MLREDKSLLVLMHISALFSGFVGPLLIWTTQKEKILDMDEHGKEAINFQLTQLIFLIVILFFGFICFIGFIIFPFWMIFMYVFPIISAINANNNKPPYYPLVIKFIV